MRALGPDFSQETSPCAGKAPSPRPSLWTLLPFAFDARFAFCEPRTLYALGPARPLWHAPVRRPPSRQTLSSIAMRAAKRECGGFLIGVLTLVSDLCCGSSPSICVRWAFSWVELQKRTVRAQSCKPSISSAHPSSSPFHTPFPLAFGHPTILTKRFQPKDTVILSHCCHSSLTKRSLDKMIALEIPRPDPLDIPAYTNWLERRDNLRT